MGKKTVTKETTEFDAAEATAVGAPVNGTHRDDEVDPVQLERSEALRAKYQYAAKRNRMAIEELEAKKTKAAESGDTDEMARLQTDLIKTMKAQLTMKQLSKMLEDGDGKSNGKSSELGDLVKEMKEAFSYLDKRLDSVEKSKSDERAMAMQQQQSQQQFQMMMAMMNRQDPNQGMLQTMLVKMLDQKSSMKDFLPMMSQMQMMGMQQSAELEKSRMAIMQEIVLHALSSGEKDWETMSLPEKAEFLMGMMKRGVGFAADKITEFKNRKYDPNKQKLLEGKKEPQKLGLNPPADPNQPQPTQEQPTALPEGSTAPPAAETDDITPIIRDRVNRILKVVETEMRLGSDPSVVFEEIEKLYFGLPDVMRNKIESEPNPMVLVAAIEPYAEKVMLDRITNMAISDQNKAEWLKHFHQAVLGLEDEEAEDDQESDNDDEGGDEPTAKDDKPTA